MAKTFKTTYLGTTKKLPTKDQVEKQTEKQREEAPEGCLFTATDPKPLIIMISPKWVAEKGGTYFTGVNLNDLGSDTKNELILEFGDLPVGSVSYSDIKAYSDDDPDCCIRTYNVNKVRALHKVHT